MKENKTRNNKIRTKKNRNKKNKIKQITKNTNNENKFLCKSIRPDKFNYNEFFEKRETEEQKISDEISQIFYKQQKLLELQSNYYYYLGRFYNSRDTEYYQELRTPEALFGIYKHKEILDRMPMKQEHGLEEFISKFIKENEKKYLQTILVKLVEYGHKTPAEVSKFFNQEEIIELKKLAEESNFKKYIFKNSFTKKTDFINILDDIKEEIAKQIDNKQIDNKQAEINQEKKTKTVVGTKRKAFEYFLI